MALSTHFLKLFPQTDVVTGVPDTYQGSELWDFSLVDPDNRRPVDYSFSRPNWLSQLSVIALTASAGDTRELCRELIAEREDGRIKLFVHFMTLGLRRDRPGLLSAGEYIPLGCEGTHADHVFAFARRKGDACVVVAVPRLLATEVSGPDEIPVGEAVWSETRLVLPPEITGAEWRNVFTGETIATTEQDGRRGLAVWRRPSVISLSPVIVSCAA